MSIEKTPNYEFGKGHNAFYPRKLSRFAEKKNIVRQKYQVRVQNLERVEKVHVSVFLCVHHTECIQCGVSSVSV